MPLVAAACRRPRSSTLAVALALVALLALAAAPAHASGTTAALSSSACRGADAQLGQASGAALRRATLCLVNRVRRAHGRRPLRASRSLAAVGSRYARQMVRTRRFSHVDAAGNRVAARVGGGGWSLVGENLGWGTYLSATPRAIVRGWMESPTHRDNVLLRSFRYLGVGLAAGAPEAGKTSAVTYTAIFGRR